VTNTTVFSLDQIRIASPCPVKWSDMKGDDTKRFCRHCKLHVFNLTNMTRADAEALVAGAEGRLCTMFWRRADGTVITRDCPVGAAETRRRRTRIAAAVAAILSLGVGAFATVAARNPRLYAVKNRLSSFEPFSTLRDWINPPPQFPQGAFMTAGTVGNVNFNPPPPVPNPLQSPKHPPAKKSHTKTTPAPIR